MIIILMQFLSSLLTLHTVASFLPPVFDQVHFPLFSHQAPIHLILLFPKGGN